MVDNSYFIVVKDIIINPAKAWETIDLENRPVKLIRNNFLFPFIIIISVSAFLGSLIYANAELSSVYSVFVGIKCFLLFYITVFATAYILKEITRPLDLGKDFAISFRLIVYSIVPLLLCQVLSRFFESLLFVNVLALYSLYIFWTGTERMLTPPGYKKMPLLIATTITFIGIYIATDLLFTMLTDRIFHKFFA
jgi:Yip1 domain